MSTRCHIIVEDPQYGDKTILYRHSDGYPNGEHGVLASLVPFVARFLKHRGWDSCYLGAQIICDQINRHRAYMRSMFEQSIQRARDKGREPSKYDVEGLANVDNDFLGFGISNQEHGDWAYIYRVTPDGIFVEGDDVETTPEEARAMLEGVIPERYQ